MRLKLRLSGFSLAVFSAFCVAPAVAVAASSATNLNQQLQAEINDYYKKYSEKEKFTAIAATVLIPQSRNSKQEMQSVVYGTIGYPPLSQPITLASLFDIGSITKSFTALLLLQLQTESKLSLDDPLGKWLPQYPNWQKVRLRQLLNMTSGIPNYSEDKDFLKKMEARLDTVWTDQELLTYAHPEQPLVTKKENQFEYSNSNYILAAMVIEKVTRDTFANQLQTRILTRVC